MKLSNREQNLLFALVILTGLALMVMWLILPLQSSIVEQQARQVTLTEQKRQLETQIATGKNLDVKIDEAFIELVTELDKIEEITPAEQFELRLQPFLTSHPISVLTWVAESPIVVTPNLPTYRKLEPVYLLKSLLDDFQNLEPGFSPLPLSQAQLVMSTINVTFIASESVYIDFLDEIAAMNSTVFVTFASRVASSNECVVIIDIYAVHKISSVTD